MVRAESSSLPFPAENDYSQAKLRKSDAGKKGTERNSTVPAGAED